MNKFGLYSKLFGLLSLLLGLMLLAFPFTFLNDLNLVFKFLMFVSSFVAIDFFARAFGIRIKGGERDKGVWKRVSQAYSAWAVFLVSVFLTVLFLIIFVFFIIPILLFSSLRAGLSASNLILLVVSLLFYAFLRKVRFKSLNQKGIKPSFLNKFFSFVFPRVCVKNNSILCISIDPRKNSKPVEINFNEIEEIKQFSGQEAAVYTALEIRPRLDLKLKTMTEFKDYLDNKIPRPSVYLQYFIRPFNSKLLFYFGKTLLIKGKNLFYFITVTKKEADAVLKKYQEKKRKNMLH